MIVCVDVSGQSQPVQQQGSPTKPQQALQADQRGTEKSPIAVKSLNTRRSDPETAQEAKQIDSKESADRWTIGLTIALVCIGFLQLLAFIVQAWVANKTVKSIESTAERQLRAYVFASHPENMSLDPNGFLSAPIAITNFGQTPAYNVTCFVYIDLKRLPLDVALDTPVHKPDASRSPLAPGEKIMQFAIPSNKLNQLEIDAIRSKKGAIFVWGDVRYTDAFKTIRHTRFCLYSTGDDFTRGELAYYHEGNDAD